MALTVTYGTLTEATITLASLGDTTGAVSSSIDNSTTKAPAAKLEIEITGLAGSVDNVDIYILESADGGTDFSTFVDLSNIRYVGSVNCNGTTIVRKILTIGNLPAHWKVYVYNDSGAALSATESQSKVSYQTITFADV